MLSLARGNKKTHTAVISSSSVSFTQPKISCLKPPMSLTFGPEAGVHPPEEGGRRPPGKKKAERQSISYQLNKNKTEQNYEKSFFANFTESKI